MIKIIRLTALLFILFWAFKAYPKEPHFYCGKTKDVMKQNFLEGYAFAATAVADNMFSIAFFIDPKNGDWKLMGVDGKDNACNIMTGIDWQFIRTVSM